MEDLKGMYTIVSIQGMCNLPRIGVGVFLRHHFTVESSPTYDTIEQKT